MDDRKGWGWWAAGNAWLCEKAEAYFRAWESSPAGARWGRRPRGKLSISPYRYGYRQPEWMEEARRALGKGQAGEELFKAIKLENL